MEEKKEKKKKRSLLLNIILVILICIIGFSLYKIGTILYEYYVGSKTYTEIEEIAGAADFTGSINWDELLKENKDVKAWLYSKDTVINYPVVQGDDNSYYLTRMVNGEYNGKGTLFIDSRNEKPFEDFLTIIYGHKMKDGSMFGSLSEYRDNEKYYPKHKTMDLITRDAPYTLEIFAVATVPADSKRYNLNVSSTSEKQAYLNWIKKNNEMKTSVEVTTNDRIVMLSTCTYEFENARLIVFGKLVEK